MSSGVCSLVQQQQILLYLLSDVSGARFIKCCLNLPVIHKNKTNGAVLLKHIKCRTNRPKKKGNYFKKQTENDLRYSFKTTFLLSLLGFSPQVGSLCSETNSMCSVIFPTATRPNVSRLVNDKLVTIMMLAPASVLCHIVVMTISCVWSNLFCGRNLTRRSFVGLQAGLISGSSALKYGGSRSSL